MTAWENRVEIPMTLREMRVLATYALRLAERRIPMMESAWDTYEMILKEAAEVVSFQVDPHEETALRSYGKNAKRGMAMLNPREAAILMHDMAEDRSFGKDVPIVTRLVKKLAKFLHANVPKILPGRAEEPPPPSEKIDIEKTDPNLVRAKFAETETIPDLEPEVINKHVYQNVGYQPTNKAYGLDPIDAPAIDEPAVPSDVPSLQSMMQGMNMDDYNRHFEDDVPELPPENILPVDDVASQDLSGQAGVHSAAGTNWSPEMATSGGETSFLDPSVDQGGEQLSLAGLGLEDEDVSGIFKAPQRSWDNPDELAQKASEKTSETMGQPATQFTPEQQAQLSSAPGRLERRMAPKVQQPRQDMPGEEVDPRDWNLSEAYKLLGIRPPWLREVNYVR
jgi:hypothetical protein